MPSAALLAADSTTEAQPVQNLESIMNLRTLLPVAALLIAGAAQASEATVDTTPFQSQLTRAEVLKAVLDARQAGQLALHEADHLRLPVVALQRSRDAVKAELAAARRSGELERLNSETLGDPAYVRVVAPAVIAQR
jgi:hypothetical protein